MNQSITPNPGPPSPPDESGPEEPATAVGNPDGNWFMRVLMLLLIAGLTVALLLRLSVDVWSVAKVVLGLGFVIFIHELGHFLVAKWCDVHVETFSIGFGPAVPGCLFQRGETTYMIGVLPLGGYVKMVGEGAEDDEGEDDPRSFKKKSVWQRMAIISAGVVMNVILACLCFSFVYLIDGKKQLAGVIGTVEAGSPAWKAGLPTGSVIHEIGKQKDDPSFQRISGVIRHSRSDHPVPLVYGPPQNPEERITLEVRPRRDKNFDPHPVIGILYDSEPTLLTEQARKERRLPVRFNSAAAAARELELKPGDQVVAATDPDKPEAMKEISAHADALAELCRRMGRLIDQPMHVEVRRAGQPAGDRPERLEVPPVGFRFDDRIVAMTDPDQEGSCDPYRVKELAPDPRDPGKDRRDINDYHQRMRRLAGQPIVIQVRRNKPSHDQPLASILVPPAYHQTLGLRMQMGKIVAIRKDGPAAKAGIQPRDLANGTDGDVLTAVEVEEPNGNRTHFVTSRSEKLPANVIEKDLDPVRLPFDLEQWAARKKEPRKVKLVVLRQVGHARQPVTLEADWDDRWSFDNALSLGPRSPLALSGLGLAYRVETTIEAVAPDSSAMHAKDEKDQEVKLEKDEVITEVRSFQPADDQGQLFKPARKATPLKLSDQPDSERAESDQWAYVFQALQNLDSKKVTFTVVGSDKVRRKVTLESRPDETWPSHDRGLLLMPDVRTQRASNLGEAMVWGVQDSSGFIVEIYLLLAGLFTGEQSFKNIGGPIEIAKTAYRLAGDDIFNFILFMGIISANLAVINFLPIPVLDGGHMVFLVYEKLRGRPAPENVRIGATLVGLVFIGLLMLGVTGLDVVRNWF